MSFEQAPVKREIEIEGFHALYYFEFDRNFYHPPERHDFWELVYVDDGNINAVVDGIGCSLSRGQVIFHQPGENHSHIANGEDASNVVVVSFSCKSPVMSFFNRKIFTLERAPKRILSLFLEEAQNALGKLPGDYADKAAPDFSHAAPGAAQLMECYLVEFLFSLIRSDENSVLAMSQTPDTRRLAESSLSDSVESYMERHLAEPPSLDVLCRHFSVSRTYLCRIFREATGTSPVDHWTRLKIKRAKAMIRQGGYNITQISEQLGYSSIHHFTRMFKRVTGMAPTAYRDSVGT
ncbi:MAG: helix-turn-helix domain-containing protein [Oscillospiraceae bacterium]|nr:helix-turn-helix domain-containing protein [Oscillospiraceae bacterium]